MHAHAYGPERSVWVPRYNEAFQITDAPAPCFHCHAQPVATLLIRESYRSILDAPGCQAFRNDCRGNTWPHLGKNSKYRGDLFKRAGANRNRQRIPPSLNMHIVCDNFSDPSLAAIQRLRRKVLGEDREGQPHAASITHNQPRPQERLHLEDVDSGLGTED
jgi:hypothetical protein